MVNPIPLLRGQYKHIVSGDGSVSPVLMSNTIARIEENGRVVENKSLSNTLRSIQYWICVMLEHHMSLTGKLKSESQLFDNIGG